jgi:hypothetical protein
VAAAGQWPAPSQFAAAVALLLAQLARRHPVEFDHCRHAPAPLHVPSFEQSPAPTLLAVQRCLGSAPPLATAEQVPTLPETLQLMHKLPVVASLHAVLQQIPSVQKPLKHCALFAQVAPMDFLPHELFTQVLGETQSLSTLQVVKQAPLAQVKGEHGLSGGVTHLPLPSHLDAGVSEDVVEQLDGLHTYKVS